MARKIENALNNVEIACLQPVDISEAKGIIEELFCLISCSV